MERNVIEYTESEKEILRAIFDPEYYDSEIRLIKELPRPVLVRIYNSAGQRRYIYRTDSGAHSVDIVSPELTFEQLDSMWLESPEREQFQEPESIPYQLGNQSSASSWHE